MLMPCPSFPTNRLPGLRLRRWLGPGMALILTVVQSTGPAHAQLQTPSLSQPTTPAQRPAAAQPSSFDAKAPIPPKGPSGQPLPRFVSLKSDRVNMRTGPGTDYPTQWVFRRAGLPVEVIREYEAWRQVRDAEGATGWVLASLLSSRRTVLVEPWEAKGAETKVGEPKPTATAPQIALKAEGREGAADVAQIEAGVIANIRTCDGRWCSVVIGR